jgi:hypothetical protein
LIGEVEVLNLPRLVRLILWEPFSFGLSWGIDASSSLWSALMRGCQGTRAPFGARHFFIACSRKIFRPSALALSRSITASGRQRAGRSSLVRVPAAPHFLLQSRLLPLGTMERQSWRVHFQLR